MEDSRVGIFGLGPETFEMFWMKVPSYNSQETFPNSHDTVQEPSGPAGVSRPVGAASPREEKTAIDDGRVGILGFRGRDFRFGVSWGRKPAKMEHFS